VGRRVTADLTTRPLPGPSSVVARTALDELISHKRREHDGSGQSARRKRHTGLEQQSRIEGREAVDARRIRQDNAACESRATAETDQQHLASVRGYFVEPGAEPVDRFRERCVDRTADAAVSANHANPGPSVRGAGTAA
jgi:hypothetical protein